MRPMHSRNMASLGVFDESCWFWEKGVGGLFFSGEEALFLWFSSYCLHGIYLAILLTFFSNKFFFEDNNHLKSILLLQWCTWDSIIAISHQIDLSSLDWKVCWLIQLMLLTKLETQQLMWTGPCSWQNYLMETFFLWDTETQFLGQCLWKRWLMEMSLIYIHVCVWRT